MALDLDTLFCEKPASSPKPWGSGLVGAEVACAEGPCGECDGAVRRRLSSAFEVQVACADGANGWAALGCNLLARLGWGAMLRMRGRWFSRRRLGRVVEDGWGLGGAAFRRLLNYAHGACGLGPACRQVMRPAYMHAIGGVQTVRSRKDKRSDP